MRYIFVDFEMNPVDARNKEEKVICGSEIIEIGAVMLDENFDEISCFKEVVKPKYNSRVYKKWEMLTGITTEMIQGAQHFELVIPRFVEWCGADDYEIYSWSNSDLSHLTKEMKQKNCDFTEKFEYMFSHWLDFQKIYDEMVSTEQMTSLEHALEACGIPFSGRQHDALSDARNTSLLFVESRINDLAQLVQIVKDAMNDDEDVVTLGDLFNFSQFEFG